MAKKSVLDYIKSEYGLEIEEYAGTEIDLKRKGYRQLSAEDIARIDALFQFAPQIVANRITEGHYKEAFKAATEGSYRILMDVGAHLGISHKTPGAFSPNTYDANNHFLRPAELIPNDATLSISQAEQLVANAFNAASLVTGQYFMAQISSSLNTLKTSVSGISDYIEDEKLSKFQSYLNKLESIARRLPFLRNNPMGTMNYVQDAEEIERFADELMDFCERRIERIEKDARFSDGEDTIDKNANDILKYLLLSYQSLLMFCEGTNVAICLEGITDANHLQVIYDGLEKKVQQYEDLFSSCIKWISHYVHNLNALNKRSPWHTALSVGGGLADGGARVWAFGLWGVISGVPSGIKTANNKMKKYDDDLKEKKAGFIQRINAGLKKVHDMEPVQSSLQTTKDYISAISKTEFIKVGDSVYTNMPLVSSQSE